MNDEFERTGSLASSDLICATAAGSAPGLVRQFYKKTQEAAPTVDPKASGHMCPPLFFKPVCM
jgi:hypothetical protein